MDFTALYESVRKARNAAVHEGALARHLAVHALEMALVLEDALMTNDAPVLASASCGVLNSMGEPARLRPLGVGTARRPKKADVAEHPPTMAGHARPSGPATASWALQTLVGPSLERPVSAAADTAEFTTSDR